ncbi:hypothetical protein HAX54_018790 [Datura stramonium]|uniref:Uncharacterized protein n=1 Tax=Datura stramonium TaxID=4076 RepID=A0ABS8UQ14_DATST|nr:hypothetical protein [Datura stramonium]
MKCRYSSATSWTSARGVQNIEGKRKEPVPHLRNTGTIREPPVHRRLKQCSALGMTKHLSPPVAASPMQANVIDVELCLPVSRRSAPAKLKLKHDSGFKASSHCPIPAFHLRVTG